MRRQKGSCLEKTAGLCQHITLHSKPPTIMFAFKVLCSMNTQNNNNDNNNTQNTHVTSFIVPHLFFHCPKNLCFLLENFNYQICRHIPPGIKENIFPKLESCLVEE